MTFEETIEWVGKGVDAAGVAAIVVGILWATVLAAARRGEGDPRAGFRAYRQRIGRAILLGLELLVAADIVRTVAVAPSFRNVGVLALIVAIRTFLSFTLELELEGRWPWERGRERV